MPRLTPDLQARFIQYRERPVDPSQFVDSVKHPDGVKRSMPYVDTLAEAHGVLFLCPKCYVANGGDVGTHPVICWFTGKVPDYASPGPGRWNPQGTGLIDLTFVPGVKSCSVAIIGGCEWHGFVTNGRAD